jgi:RNA polymerase sigma-70 factor (ECF subfamily)
MTSATVAPIRRRPSPSERLGMAFAATRPALQQTLTGVLGSPDDAQDVLQEAFLKCWRARKRVWCVRNLRAWIFRVGLNAARDFQRNAWRRKSRPLPTQITLPDASATPPCDQLLNREDLDRVRQALTGLRSDEREVFLLRQNSDLTYDEIAAKRSAPVGTVKTQMRAALHKLRAVLAKG